MPGGWKEAQEGQRGCPWVGACGPAGWPGTGVPEGCCQAAAQSWVVQEAQPGPAGWQPRSLPGRRLPGRKSPAGSASTCGRAALAPQPPGLLEEPAGMR